MGFSSQVFTLFGCTVIRIPVVGSASGERGGPYSACAVERAFIIEEIGKFVGRDVSGIGLGR